MSSIERIIAASLSGLATAVMLVVVSAAANLQATTATASQRSLIPEAPGAATV